MTHPAHKAPTSHHIQRHPCALVTGGAGFIGSHLVDHLLDTGYRVVVIDDLSTGHRANLDTAAHNAPDRLTIIEGTVEEHARSAIAEHRPNEIYHLAAAVGVERVVKDPAACVESNCADTVQLFRATLDHAPDARVLFASSSEVYGKSTAIPFREDADITLGLSGSLRWSYAVSKLVGEALALAHRRDHGLATVVARFFNIVGPRQSGDHGMVLPRFVNAAIEGKPLKVFGDGTQSRCFCDVRDIVPALPKLAAHAADLDVHDTIVNLGANRDISIAQLATVVTETLQSDSPIDNVPYHDAYGPGFEDLNRRVPDLSRAERLVGFHATTPIQQTILDLASHHSQHQANDANRTYQA